MRLFRWALRNYHEAMVAFWENQIDVARHERDWEALDRALDRKHHHERALVRDELAGRS